MKLLNKLRDNCIGSPDFLLYLGMFFNLVNNNKILKWQEGEN